MVHPDYRASLSLVGTVIKYTAVPLALPFVLALWYSESVLPFIVTFAVAVTVGTALERLRPNPDLGHREGFLMVGLTWLAIPLVGTLPYLVAGNGTVAVPVNALFESMSGFTTTGATVMGEISFEQHSRSLLMWRQLTQWLGGMGIVVLMIAILPELSVGGAQLAEVEAPVVQLEKLTPRMRETARALWIVYVGFTAALMLLYYGLHLAGFAPNMGLYNALAHAFTTMPTGGFSPEARSFEAFSPAAQWIAIPFMIVAGTNFALFWHAFTGNPQRFIRNQEFRSYIAAVFGVGVLLTVLLFTGVGFSAGSSVIGAFEPALREALFQAASIVTTTGYASADFNNWSSSAQTILLLSMFLGGSAGSAAGSIKIVRWYTIQQSIRRELFTTIHPEAIRPVRFADRVFDEDTIRGLFAFTVLFLALFAISTVIIFLDAARIGMQLSTIEAMSVAVATLGNIGPGFGIVGPMDSYLLFSDSLKLYMVFLMWIGRLEIISVLVLLTPAYWRR